VARQNKNNFTVLVGVAAGYEFPSSSSSAATAAAAAAGSENIDQDIQNSKTHLMHLMNSPGSTATSGISLNDPLLTSMTMKSGAVALTNQFIFPQSNLFEGDSTTHGKAKSTGSTTTMMTQGSHYPNTAINTMRSSSALIPGMASASEIVAATTAAEVAGIKLPSISSLTNASHNMSSNASALMSTNNVNNATTLSSSNHPEEHSAAILRLKASTMKERSEQAKLLLEYYDTCKILSSVYLLFFNLFPFSKDGRSVPPFARPGLDKLKQKSQNLINNSNNNNETNNTSNNNPSANTQNNKNSNKPDTAPSSSSAHPQAMSVHHNHPDSTAKPTQEKSNKAPKTTASRKKANNSNRQIILAAAASLAAHSSDLNHSQPPPPPPPAKAKTPKTSADKPQR
jgi:hypothetical protein